MAIGEHDRLLWEKKYIKEEIGGYKFRVGLSTFYSSKSISNSETLRRNCRSIYQKAQT